MVLLATHIKIFPDEIILLLTKVISSIISSFLLFVRLTKTNTKSIIIVRIKVFLTINYLLIKQYKILLKYKIGVFKFMTHAKAIFFGEHAVVYGYKGITIPLPQMNVEVTLEETDTIQQRDEILSFIADSCGIDNKTKINITSTIPVGRGLGSSAALSIAIARAKKLPNVREIANKCEKFIHGNPSGIDVNQVLSDTPLLFSKKEGASELDFDLNSYLLIIDTGVVGITKETLKHIADNYDKYEKYIAELGGITDLVIEPLKNKHIDLVGEYMYKAHDLLCKLGVSHASNDEVVEICKNNNAVGAKLTGGGAGGCCISLSKTKENALEIQNVLKEKGYSSWIVTV